MSNFIRDAQGRIVKGGRLSPATEIKPGQRLSPATQFKPGERRSPQTEFGNVPVHNKLPVGSVTIRNRLGRQRAFVKVAEPNSWKARASVVWEQNFGAVPKGFVIHHKDRNTLNDSITNLEIQSRSQHVQEHRQELLAARKIKQNAISKI